MPIVSSSGVTGWHDAAKVKGPGVVTGRYGTLGQVFFVPNDFWPLNTSLYVRDFKGNDPRFVAYFLRTVLTRPGSDKAAVPGVNRNHLHAQRVLVTVDVDEQKEIASQLSRYDGLIENNQRRTALLEQAMRLLYEEWFVRLRFPGHESTDVAGAAPQGWRRKRIGEIAPFQYGKSLKKQERVPGRFPVYGSSGVIGTHHTSLVTGPTILIGRKGNVGSVFWSSTDCYPIDTVYFIESPRCSEFLYHALRTVRFLNTDVAVPGLNRSLAHGLRILVPDARTLGLFEAMVAPIRRQTLTLTNSSALLARARDLLLPRLMSGEVAA